MRGMDEREGGKCCETAAIANYLSGLVGTVLLYK